MAPVAVEQDQEQDEAVAMQQAQMQQMQAQQQEQQERVSLLAMFRHRKKIKELQKKIRFHRNRAAEHEDDYFMFLAVLAAIVDFVEVATLIPIIGFIVYILSLAVPLAYRALFFWGPRSYVWRGQAKSVIFAIGDIAIEENPLTKWVPANTADVCVRWLWSIEHKEADLILAREYEIRLKMLLRKVKRAKL